MSIDEIRYYYSQIIKYFLQRLEYISDVSKDIAQVLFGVLVIESLIRDNTNWYIVVWGLLLAMIFWIAGVMSYRL